MPVIDTRSRRRVEANRSRRKIVVRSRGKITFMISNDNNAGSCGKSSAPGQNPCSIWLREGPKERRIKRAAEYSRIG
jgi:hypothetical protein